MRLVEYVECRLPDDVVGLEFNDPEEAEWFWAWWHVIGQKEFAEFTSAANVSGTIEDM